MEFSKARKTISKCLFPVAGYGTRFLPATKNMPKEMLPILDKPLIQYAVEEAYASGMDRICFVTGRGKRALEDQVERGPGKLFVSMTVDCDVAPAHIGDPVFSTGGQVGAVTSGGYGHRVRKNIAFAFVEPDQAEIGTRLQVGILGGHYNAEVTALCLYDPENELVRS